MTRWLFGIGVALALSGTDALTSQANAQSIVVQGARGTHGGHHGGHDGHHHDQHHHDQHHDDHSYGYHPPYPHYDYHVPYGYYHNHYYSTYRPPVIRYRTLPGQIGIYPYYGYGVPSTASAIYGYRSARPSYNSYNSGIPRGGAWGVGY